MRTCITIAGILLVSLAVVICSCNHPKPQEAKVELDEEKLVERGSYLVRTMGCDDCHSPKRMGPRGPEIIPELRLSGFQKSNVLPKVDISAVQQGWALFYPDQTASIGPWGVSFAANLTSDATGIGHWSEEQFEKALKEGKSKGLDSNRPLLPPMPWPNYIDLHDDDLKAIFAFLKALPPVDNVVPVPVSLADLEGK